MLRSEELNTGMSTYPSKRDWWLMAILWIAAIFFIYTALTVHKEPVAPWMKVFATCLSGILALLTIALVGLAYFSSYSLDPVNLTIKIGPFRKKIPTLVKYGEIPDLASAMQNKPRFHIEPQK